LFFAVQNAGLLGTPTATNAALVDVGETAVVAGQLGDALEAVYSYDFARLGENERAAREVITPGLRRRVRAAVRSGPGARPGAAGPGVGHGHGVGGAAHRGRSRRPVAADRESGEKAPESGVNRRNGGRLGLATRLAYSR